MQKHRRTRLAATGRVLEGAEMKIAMIILACAFTVGLICAISYGLVFLVPSMLIRTVIMFPIGFVFGIPLGTLIYKIRNG